MLPGVTIGAPPPLFIYSILYSSSPNHNRKHVMINKPCQSISSITVSRLVVHWTLFSLHNYTSRTYHPPTVEKKKNFPAQDTRPVFVYLFLPYSTPFLPHGKEGRYIYIYKKKNINRGGEKETNKIHTPANPTYYSFNPTHNFPTQNPKINQNTQNNNQQRSYPPPTRLNSACTIPFSLLLPFPFFLPRPLKDFAPSPNEGSIEG